MPEAPTSPLESLIGPEPHTPLDLALARTLGFAPEPLVAGAPAESTPVNA